MLLTPKDERKRSSDRIAQDLRHELQGTMPGVIIRANASGGNGQLNQFLSGGQGYGGGRLALEIRGEDLAEARALAVRAKDLMADTPGIADARVSQDDARPELSVRIDRAKAALLGITATDIANTIRTNVAGTQAAMFRESGNEYPIIVRLREDQRQNVGDVGDVMVSTPRGTVMQVKNLMTMAPEDGPVQIQRKNMQRMMIVSARTGDHAQRGRRRR